MYVCCRLTCAVLRRSKAQCLRTHGAAEATEQRMLPGDFRAGTNDRSVLIARLDQRGLVERVQAQHGFWSQLGRCVLPLVLAGVGVYTLRSRAQCGTEFAQFPTQVLCSQDRGWVMLRRAHEACI